MRDSNNTFTNGFNFNPNQVGDLRSESRTRTTVQNDIDRLHGQNRNLNQRVRSVEAQVAHNAELLDFLDYQVNENMYVAPVVDRPLIDQGAIEGMVDRQFDARVAQELANRPRQRMGFWGMVATVTVAWSLTGLIKFLVDKWARTRAPQLSSEQIYDLKNNLIEDPDFVRDLAHKMRPHLQQELRVKADHIDEIARQLKNRRGWCKEVFELSGEAFKLRKMEGDVEAQMKRVGEVEAILRNAHEQYDASAGAADEMAWALMLCRDLAGVDENKG